MDFEQRIAELKQIVAAQGKEIFDLQEKDRKMQRNSIFNSLAIMLTVFTCWLTNN